MTIDLDAIRARLEAATSGPWRECKSYGAVVSDRPTLRYKSKEEADLDREFYGGYPICESATSFDRELIIHAPTDIADLLTEVERLEGELAKFSPCDPNLEHDNTNIDYDDYCGRDIYHKDEEC